MQSLHHRRSSYSRTQLLLKTPPSNALIIAQPTSFTHSPPSLSSPAPLMLSLLIRSLMNSGKLFLVTAFKWKVYVCVCACACFGQVMVDNSDFTPSQVGCLFTFLARQLAKPDNTLFVNRKLFDQVTLLLFFCVLQSIYIWGWLIGSLYYGVMWSLPVTSQIHFVMAIRRLPHA